MCDLILQWGIVDAEIMTPSAETQELSKCISFKPGVGQDLAMHASQSARNCGRLISAFPLSSASFSFWILSSVFRGYHSFPCEPVE